MVKCPVCSGHGWLLVKQHGETTDIDCDLCLGRGSITEQKARDL